MTIEDLFPNLQTTSYAISSDPTHEYNCTAFAADDQKRWWEPNPACYWPLGALMEYTIPAYIQAFNLIGYNVCTNKDLEPNLEKVALYATFDGIPQHMAKQMPTGHWKSKLGEGPDIEHPTLEGLESLIYGFVVTILCRPIQT